MYNYYPTQPNRQPSFGLKGRPVSSLEEVRATSIDFDGSIFYFPDLANKRIYTKQINMDGTASLNMYELKPVPKETVNDYITRAEFEEAIKFAKRFIGSSLIKVEIDVKGNKDYHYYDFNNSCWEED